MARAFKPKICLSCGKEFLPVSGAQKRDKICAKEYEKEYNRKSTMEWVNNLKKHPESDAYINFKENKKTYLKKYWKTYKRRPDSIAKHNQKHRVANKNHQALSRKILNDRYVKSILKGIGITPTPELITLKRKTIKLKRASNEYKQAIENQNTGRNRDDARQGNRIYETIRPERPVQYETNQLNPANG